MRRLEDHIGPDELASLPESLEAQQSEGRDRQLLLHLARCKECADLAESNRTLRRLGALEFAAQTSCSSQNEWLEFAEGLHPEHSASMLAHAARCSDCAALLREVMTLMQSVEPEVPVQGLESTTPAWQKRMARRLMLDSGRKDPAPLRTNLLARFLGWTPWVMAPSAAVLLFAIAFFGFALWRRANPSEASLLALAYNQQRTLVLRIPGGNPVPMASGTRGSGSGPAESVALLELRVRAQKHLEQTPNSGYWHQVLGEVDLLEGDGVAARRNLEIAQMADANLPDLLPDLAGAWFELGDKTGSAEAFAEAAELYSKQLDASNHDASLLYYNRALCWERQGAVRNAIGDLQKALTVEPAPEWRKAIEGEIARLSGNSWVTPQLNQSAPVAELSANSANFGPETLNYEDALDRATAQLLPRWEPDPAVRTELAQIAQSGLRHRDRWLQDWLAGRHTPLSEDGDRHLATATRAGSAGNAQDSLDESRQALSSYENAGNVPGRLRALLAETYALQRLDRSRECLAVAADLEREPRVRDYAWIETQLTLEEGSCRFLSGDYESASQAFNQAFAKSADYRLNWLHLRALGGQAQILDLRGNPVGAWQLNATALHLCQQFHCPPIREYAFVYTMAECAETLSLHRVALELMRTGEKLAAASGDATTTAYAIENLAMIAGRNGNFEESDRAFDQASKFAVSRQAFPSVELYRAEWQTDQAEILSHRGEPLAALNLLRQNERTLLSSDYQQGRLHYFTQTSGALLANNDLDAALTSALAAVRESEKTLLTLHSVTEKEQWQRENAQPYVQLIKVYLRRKQNIDAWKAWERYRYLADNDAHQRPIELVGPEPAFRTNSTAHAGEQILVFALVDDTYVGWLVTTEPLRLIRTAVLGDRARMHQLETTFYHLCSDRDSSINDIRNAGEALYLALLQPFANMLESSGRLWFDLDPSLTSIAMSALVLPGGKWLGASHEIRILPSWWTIHPQILSDDVPLLAGGRALIVNGFGRNQDTYSEASTIGSFFPNTTLLEESAVTPQALLAKLPSAELFHFSGHASAESGSTRLLASTHGEMLPALGAESVSSLHLEHCRIAVLAACNTTASNPDHLEYAPDLRNALLRSGVHGVIASQWDVDDRSTGALMNAFYRQLILGDSPAHSLQLAQQSMQADPRWQHPFYWASFQFFAN
jgi:CHAT domain-containing protein